MKQRSGFFSPPRKDCWKQQNFGSCIYPLEGVLTPNPILKVLSTFKTCEVKCLLIGGQACIIYGAVEFSRDSDFVILADSENMERLKNALKALEAKPVYFPEFRVEYLRKGHACHFRCEAEDVMGLRIDMLSVLRGCAPFDELWKRRKTVTINDGTDVDVIGLSDLVQSKKTQRDKDWFMIKRLTENDIALNKDNPSPDQVKWWFRESRTPEHLRKLAEKYPDIIKETLSQRPLLDYAIQGDLAALSKALYEGEQLERQKDIEYWKPLRKELEMLQHDK